MTDEQPKSQDTAGQPDVREHVRAHYAATALTVLQGQTGSCCDIDTCCTPDGSDEWSGPSLYDQADRAGLPEAALIASLGCGNPTAVADLRPGQTVLDLGCGGGIDVLLSARRVGPAGKVYGLDMTEQMLELARRNAADAGATNVEFLLGHIEDIPLADDTVDVIVSNCVVNLSTNKPAVFASAYRVLRPGGHLGITDVVTEDRLTAEDRAQRGSWAGCVAGALPVGEYRASLRDAGFTDIDISLTQRVADGVHSAIIRATKPTTPPRRTER